MEKTETLTISRVGTEKEVQTKFGLKKKQGVQFKEYGDLWHDIWASGLKVGQTLTGTRESREWEGKTYWKFKLPKKEDIVGGKLEEILIKLGQFGLVLNQIKEATVKPRQGVVRTEVDYPEEDIDPEDIPF